MNGRPLVVTFVDQGVDDFWPIDTVSVTAQ
jgi:hypothetical protein